MTTLWVRTCLLTRRKTLAAARSGVPTHVRADCMPLRTPTQKQKSLKLQRRRNCVADLLCARRAPLIDRRRLAVTEHPLHGSLHALTRVDHGVMSMPPAEPVEHHAG